MAVNFKALEDFVMSRTMTSTALDAAPDAMTLQKFKDTARLIEHQRESDLLSLMKQSIKAYSVSDDAVTGGLRINVDPAVGDRQSFLVDREMLDRAEFRKLYQQEWPVRDYTTPEQKRSLKFHLSTDAERKPVNGAACNLGAFPDAHVLNVCTRANVITSPENKRIAAYAVGLSLDLLLQYFDREDPERKDDIIEEFRYALEAFAGEVGFERFDPWRKT